MSTTDRLARLLADLEAQGIDAERLRVILIAGVPCTRRCDHPFCDRYRVLRALADAAAEPERAEECPRCESDDPTFRFVGCHGSPHPWHDGGSQ